LGVLRVRAAKNGENSQKTANVPGRDSEEQQVDSMYLLDANDNKSFTVFRKVDYSQ
jgi:hypothetical protein